MLTEKAELLSLNFAEMENLARKKQYVKRKPMGREEAFLKLYQQMDEYLRHHSEQKRDSSFSQRLDELSQKHPALRQYIAKLKDYGNLRNAIVHQGEWIAEPSERALQEFEHIVQTITSPPKLIPLFQKSNIRLFAPQDLLVTALRHMRECDYSQKDGEAQ